MRRSSLLWTDADAVGYWRQVVVVGSGRWGFDQPFTAQLDDSASFCLSFLSVSRFLPTLAEFRDCSANAIKCPPVQLSYRGSDGDVHD